MFSHIEYKVRHFHISSKITDHKSEFNAILISGEFIKSRNGKNVPKKTTAGSKLIVKWNEVPTSWVPLKDLKASNLLELVEYTINDKIEFGTFLHWWVRGVAKLLDRNIGKVDKKYWKTHHKFGMRVPKTVDEVLHIEN